MKYEISRRSMLAALGAGAAGLSLAPLPALAEGGIVAKRIPSSKEAIPVIGMGTWQTFNVGSDDKLRDARTEVLRTFFDLGGGVVDSSPMYGSSQAVIGYGLRDLTNDSHLFSADKIWTTNGKATRSQFTESANAWGVTTFDLMQVHNLVAWRDHLAALREMKTEGLVRYIGVTTSHGRRHDELEQILKTETLDFVQLTYNLVDRAVEKRLLPLARERGVAVIANRPYRGGSLIDGLKRGSKPVPGWARDVGVHSWAEFALKWIVSHPAITCAIPATTRVDHMRENMGACRGALPDEKLRAKMLATVS